MDKEEEVSHEEYQIELMEKHHKEMVSAIRNIKFPEPKDESAILVKLNSSIELMVKKLEVLQSPKITVEKTEVNQKEVVDLLKNLIASVDKLSQQEVKEVKDEKKEFSFSIVRDDFGNIKSVKAKQI